MSIVRDCSRYGDAGREALLAALTLVLPPDDATVAGMFATFDAAWPAGGDSA